MGMLGKWLAGPRLVPPSNFFEAFCLLLFRVISGCVWGFVLPTGLLHLAGMPFAQHVEPLLIPAAIIGFAAGFFFGLELLDMLRKETDRK